MIQSVRSVATTALAISSSPIEGGENGRNPNASPHTLVESGTPRPSTGIPARANARTSITLRPSPSLAHPGGRPDPTIGTRRDPSARPPHRHGSPGTMSGEPEPTELFLVVQRIVHAPVPPRSPGSAVRQHRRRQESPSPRPTAVSRAQYRHAEPGERTNAIGEPTHRVARHREVHLTCRRRERRVLITGDCGPGDRQGCNASDRDSGAVDVGERLAVRRVDDVEHVDSQAVGVSSEPFANPMLMSWYVVSASFANGGLGRSGGPRRRWAV